jgi:hypothetical protein
MIEHNVEKCWRVWNSGSSRHLVHLEGANAPYSVNMNDMDTLNMAAAAPTMFDLLKRCFDQGLVQNGSTLKEIEDVLLDATEGYKYRG